MYIAHTSNNLFFSLVDSGYAMFALSSRDKTNHSTETYILYCYDGTIKERKKKLDIKNILFCALCSCVLVFVVDGGVVVVVVVVVVFQLS